MILAAHGITRTQRQLAKEAKTPMTRHSGTELKHMLKVLISHGFKVRAGQKKKISDLRKALKDKIIFIAYTDPFDNYGHYVIVRSCNKDTISFIDPDRYMGRFSLPISKFKNLWKDPVFTKSVRWAAFVDAPKKKR